jgi:hypothetical protein
MSQTRMSLVNGFIQLGIASVAALHSTSCAVWQLSIINSGVESDELHSLILVGRKQVPEQQLWSRERPGGRLLKRNG